MDVVRDDTGLDLDDPSRWAQFHLEADRLSVVSRSAGHVDIGDAWRQLWVQGMQRVIGRVARPTTAWP